ncbi:hypothetical protein Rsub_00852 [Raphidocelis subcapitata]|uniref:Uncharacterized protein n=1 Tax=Raphidocelis subcapitata TaxID=307507 RepID=A0A2V0NRE9_9CHLO|nr:hypothetical protein Rsub_00852 [Raphidocelis subcapitata]|eukprot:GBF88140.1 hypothetical protein Rsub_00852 [Raphidocelis subcapitata]
MPPRSPTAPPPPPPVPRHDGPRAPLHPLTLALSPPELEAAFWREAGTPAYALSDRFGLALTISNHVFLWRAMRSLSSADVLLDGCPAPLTAVAKVIHLVSLSVALATFAASLLAPARYRAVREPLAIGQRLLVQGCTSAAGYGRRIAGDLAAAAPATPTGSVLKHLSLPGVLWAVQVLVFAFRVRWAAPVQIAAAAAGVFALRGFACAVRAEPAAAAAAAQLCDWVEAASGDTLAPAWPRLHDLRGLCADGAAEFLVVLMEALSSLLPLYALYSRERYHKLRYLRSHGLLDEGNAPGRALTASGLRHAAAIVCCVVASIFVADAAVSLGWRYECP